VMLFSGCSSACNPSDGHYGFELGVYIGNGDILAHPFFDSGVTFGRVAHSKRLWPLLEGEGRMGARL
jgi:hypothetical protein